jgi:beta-1,2-mannobiose phosphorylase / 1,2-beta-oligomannan phosphorylase
MLPRLFNQCLLRPSDVEPSRPDLEVIGVFNPGAIAYEGGVMMLVRVAERPRLQRQGYTGLPRWDCDSGELVIDWVQNDRLTEVDARVVQFKETGLLRLTFISHLSACFSRTGRSIDSLTGVRLQPSEPYEEFGLEDPRIVRIGDQLYITYVAVSRHGAATALASTPDFRSFSRHGIIFCPENKDVVLFPEKIAGRYVALHRPNPATGFSQPQMWIAFSPDLLHWGGHQRFLGGTGTWDQGRIGAGAPPFRTQLGWIEIYHGNSRRPGDAGVGTYSAGLLLLDSETPWRVLATSGAIFVPEADYESTGFVPNVVFPTGVVEQGDKILVYYGAADTCTAVVELSRQEMLDSLLIRR